MSSNTEFKKHAPVLVRLGRMIQGRPQFGTKDRALREAIVDAFAQYANGVLNSRILASLSSLLYSAAQSDQKAFDALIWHYIKVVEDFILATDPIARKEHILDFRRDLFTRGATKAMAWGNVLFHEDFEVSLISSQTHTQLVEQHFLTQLVSQDTTLHHSAFFDLAGMVRPDMDWESRFNQSYDLAVRGDMAELPFEKDADVSTIWDYRTIPNFMSEVEAMTPDEVEVVYDPIVISAATHDHLPAAYQIPHLIMDRGHVIYQTDAQYYLTLAQIDADIDMVKSSALRPPTCQRIYHLVMDKAAPRRAGFNWDLNEGIHNGRPSMFKLWEYDTAKSFMEFFALKNMSTRGNYFLVGLYLQSMLDGQRICFEGCPNETSMFCKYSSAPFGTCDNCPDLTILSALDAHKMPVSLLFVYLASCMRHLHTHGDVKEIQTNFGTERVFVCADPIAKKGEIYLTGPQGLKKGMFITVVVGRQREGSVNITMVKVKAFLEFCGFETYYHEAVAGLNICMEPSGFAKKLSIMDRLAYGLAFVRYQSDEDAIVTFDIDHYLLGCGYNETRCHILKNNLAPKGLTEEIVRREAQVIARRNGNELSSLFTRELRKAYNGVARSDLAEMRAEAVRNLAEFATPEEYHLAGGAVFDQFLIEAGDFSFIDQELYHRELYHRELYHY